MRRLDIPDNVLPPAHKKGEASALFARINEPGVRAKLITGYVRLVAKLALEHAGRRVDPNDLFGVGQIALVIAVDSLTNGDTATAFIAKRIKGVMRNACALQHSTRNPDTLEPLRPGDSIQVRNRELSGVEFVESIHDDNQVAMPWARTTPELADAIEAACQTDREREVVRLTGEGHGQDEIRMKLGLSLGTINNTLAAVRGRLITAGFEIPDKFSQFLAAG